MLRTIMSVCENQFASWRKGKKKAKKQLGIVGPMSTGKSSIVREMCNISPGGVLYCEAENVCRKLAIEVNMKISPPNTITYI